MPEKELLEIQELSYGQTQSLMSRLKPEVNSTRFHALFLESLDNVLVELLGPRIRAAIYEYVDRELCCRSDIPEHVDELWDLLDTLMGRAGKVVQKRVLKRLHEKLPRTEALTTEAEKRAVVTQPAETTQSKPENVSVSARTSMYCNQCGAVIPRDSKFCKECGTKLTLTCNVSSPDYCKHLRTTYGSGASNLPESRLLLDMRSSALSAELALSSSSLQV